MMTNLVIAAHPDDEVLGCGGCIAQLTKDGNEVHIAILGEGITSRYARREETDKNLVNALHEASKKVATRLGANGLSLFGLPDNRFDTVPMLEVVKLVEQLIEEHRPNAIYTHHGGDLNLDHQVVHRAVLTATRPTREQTVRELYAFEVPSSTEWAFQSFQPVFKPNVFVDISAFIGVKQEAMNLYESEVREFPHPRSAEAIKCVAHRWGSVVGCQSAEAFELIRDVRGGRN